MCTQSGDLPVLGLVEEPVDSKSEMNNNMCSVEVYFVLTVRLIVKSSWGDWRDHVGRVAS